MHIINYAACKMQATTDEENKTVLKIVQAAWDVHEGDERHEKVAKVYLGGRKLSDRIVHSAMWDVQQACDVSEYEAMNLVLCITGLRCAFCDGFCRRGGVSGFSCVEAAFHPYSLQECIIALMLARVPTKNLAKTQ